LEEYSGESYRSLKREIQGDGILAPTIHDAWKGDRESTVRDVLGEPVDEEALSLYESAAGHPYLLARGILDETAEDLGLRVDPNNHGVERVLFPVYAPDGRFYGYSGRATNDSAVPKVRDYFGLDKRLLLLGSHLVVPARGALLILVEGLFDYAIVSQLGHPVVASMHARLTEPQAQILREFGLPVVVFYDNDKAGKEGVDIAVDALRGFVPVLGVSYPKGKQFKDPGGLPDDVIDSMIADAYLL
jgi:DNA primase